jgi:hypothetical protein
LEASMADLIYIVVLLVAYGSILWLIQAFSWL